MVLLLPTTSGTGKGNVKWSDYQLLHCKSSRYVVTWKIGCSTFEQHEAKEYCNSMGMEPVSLDTPAKQNEFNRLIAQDAQRFFWTGGIVDHANQVVGWSNPASNTIRFSDSLHWSHTGGAGLPQPDNRAAGENPPHPEVSSQPASLSILICIISSLDLSRHPQQFLR